MEMNSVQLTNLIINESSERKVIEQVGEEPPDIGVTVFSEAFVVIAICLGDLPRFVISSQDSDTIATLKFQGDKERHSLYRVVPSVHVVPHE